MSFTSRIRMAIAMIFRALTLLCSMTASVLRRVISVICRSSLSQLLSTVSLTSLIVLLFVVTPTLAWSSESSTCSHCDGSGYVVAYSPCFACDSSGKVGDKVCEVCKGSRYVSSLVDCPVCDFGKVSPVDTSPATVTMQDGSLDPVITRLDDMQMLFIALVALVSGVLGSLAFLNFWRDLSSTR